MIKLVDAPTNKGFVGLQREREVQNEGGFSTFPSSSVEGDESSLSRSIADRVD